MDVKLWTGEEFATHLGVILGKASAIWDDCAQVFLQAVLHYHQASFDTSRPMKVDQMLIDAGLGTQQAAFRLLLRKTTGITGIGGVDDWKHNKQQLAALEGPLELLERVTVSGHALKEFGGGVAGNKKGGSRSGTKRTSVTLPEKFSELEQNALKAFVTSLEGIPDSARLDAIRNAGKVQSDPFSALKSPEAREAMAGLVKEIAEQEKISPTDAVASIAKFTEMAKKFKQVIRDRLQAILNSADETADEAANDAEAA